MRIEHVGEEDFVLSEGDRITVGITHHIKVSGDDSWVKYEVVSAVREGETTQAATTRVVDHVNARAMEVVHETVDAIRKVIG